MAGRDSKLAHHPHKQQDSILVQIAQKPLLVAALFLLTALLPWALSSLAPLVVKAFQEKSLLDLARWLSAPFLFALVNFAIFFLWINSSSSAAVRRRAPLVEGAEDEIIVKPDILGIIPPRHDDRFVVVDDAALVAAEAEPPPSSAVRQVPSPAVRQPPSSPVRQAPSSAVRQPPSSAVRQPPSEVEAAEFLDRPPQRKLAHQRSRSWTIDPAILQLAADRTAPDTTRERTAPVRTPLSKPKSKTPGARRVSAGEANKFDPAVINAMDKSRNVARRINSSPKPDEELAAEQQQYHQMRTAQSSKTFVYTPPVREQVREPVHEPVREPIPLEKDDLNARIESFLTRFKMQRQESNLKALLS